MKRENRYIVIKRSDADDLLNKNEIRQLNFMLHRIAVKRNAIGKSPTKNYVVVGEDWPMYEQTWQAVEQWVDSMEKDHE